MRIVPVASACVLSIYLGGCAFVADPNAWPQKFQYGDSNTLVMGGNLRMVTERDRERLIGPPLPTVCTEPSPDVAVAFGRALAAQGSYSQPSGPSVSGNVSASTTEQATALAGRTAGVLALRDGLYAACQAYTNGILGQDAYAMVLSQYGNLLVALAGVNTGSGAEQAYTPYSPQDVAIATLLVSCISEHDPTRLGAVAPNGRPIPNQMLSGPFCHNLLARIASGKLVTPPKPSPADKEGQNANKNSAPPGQATQSVSIKVTGPSNAGASGGITPAAAAAAAAAPKPTTPTKPPEPTSPKAQE